MSKTFKHRLLVWLWDGINAFLNGVAGGLLAILGGEAVGAADFTLRQLAVVCIVSGVLAWANYVRTRGGLPPIDADCDGVDGIDDIQDHPIVLHKVDPPSDLGK